MAKRVVVTAGASGIGLALAGVLWMKIDKEGKTWQDRYSMSEVVLLPKGFYGLK